MSLSRVASCSALCVALISLAPRVSAQTPPPAADPALVTESPEMVRARMLFDEGRRRADEQRWEEALALFRSSLELVERPSTVWNVAGCLVRLQRRVEAIPQLERFLSIADAGVDAADIAEARTLLEEARRMVARLEIHIEPPEAEVDVDGVVTAAGAVRRVELDPGVHVVRATYAGRVAALREIRLEDGAHLREAIELPLRNPPPRLSIEGTAEGATLGAGGLRATVHIDGEPRGELPIELELSAGEHLVEVHAEGMRPWSRQVRAREGRVVELSATLSPIEQNFLESEVFWAVVGGVLGAGALVGAAFGIAEAAQPSPGGGSTGLVILVLTGTF